MDDANQASSVLAGTSEETAMRVTPASALKPKGACWYCNQPLDNIRRFCGKECADDYKTEEEAFNSAGS